MERSKIKGHLAILSANVIWGLMTPISKAVTNTGQIDAMTLAAMRILGGAILFWGLSLLRIVPQEKVERKDWSSFVFAALLVTFINQFLVINGVGLTSPIDASVMCSTTPILTLLIGWALMGDRPGWHRNVGVTLGFCGILIFILTGKTDHTYHVSNPVLGNAMCLVSQVSSATYFVKYRGLTQRYSPFTLMKWFFLIASVPTLIVSAPHILATEWSRVEVSVYLNAAYVVIFGTFLAYILMPIAQRYLKPTSVAMYNYSQPVLSAFFSVAVGLATMSWHTVIATLFIFVGVGLVNRK